MTRLPRTLFQALPPSSLLVCGQTGSSEHRTYELMVISSGDPMYDECIDIFELGPAFRFGLMKPRGDDADQTMARAIYTAISNGTLGDYIVAAQLPTVFDHSLLTQQRFLAKHERADFSARSGSFAHGDALVELCEMQFQDFLVREKKLRAAQMVLAVEEAGAGSGRATDNILGLLRGFEKIVDVGKSMRGSRVSRMGSTFEAHISRILTDEGLAFVAQPKLDKGKPDFVLPSLTAYRQDDTGGSAIVLAAKSTLRERWRQIPSETPAKKHHLATLDNTVPEATLDDIERAGITLVVPEQFCRPAAPRQAAGIYAKVSNVMSMSAFVEHAAERFGRVSS